MPSFTLLAAITSSIFLLVVAAAVYCIRWQARTRQSTTANVGNEQPTPTQIPTTVVDLDALPPGGLSNLIAERNWARRREASTM